MRRISNSTETFQGSFRVAAGIMFLTAGGLLFLDQYLNTGWLSLSVMPAIGLFLYAWGIRARVLSAILAGSVLACAGFGSMVAWDAPAQAGQSAGLLGMLLPKTIIQAAWLLLFTAAGWMVGAISAVAFTNRAVWWALLPAGILGAAGACILLTPLRWYDVVLYLALGTGLPLLFWGLASRLFGLVIPGSLLVTVGPGVFLAWQGGETGNALVRIGIMLVWFAGGWFLMTLGGRYIRQRYIWWPLIPGSILGVAGMGLYIGGDPSRALGFIGNTGSIALMIFGLYLLLMRKSIHH